MGMETTAKASEAAQADDAGKGEMDAETYELAQLLLQLVRAGDTPRLERLLRIGLPPNLRDSKGSSLLLLASYNGHYEMTRLLLEHGGDSELPNDRGQVPLTGPRSRATPRSPSCSSSTAPTSTRATPMEKPR
jgi:hypothetical protein